MSIEARRASLELRLRQFGGPLNEPAVKAQFLAQVMHESGGLRYVREVWGPTAAQSRYEGRADLGNTQPGDGKRFMGRDVLQVTGRANYHALTAWVRKTFGQGPDFEAEPELLESPEWLGIGAIWYFLAARKDLIGYCRAGNIEMVTRRVNGGLNGYADRLKWYDRSALEMLGHKSVSEFQIAARLDADGISGPKTRAAMHDALLMLADQGPVKSAYVKKTPEIEHNAMPYVKNSGKIEHEAPADALSPSPVDDSRALVPATKPMPSDAMPPPPIMPDGSTKWVIGIGGLFAAVVAIRDTLADWWQSFLSMF